MAIPITEHPGYGAAMAAYQAARTQAAESGDPAQISKVEFDWQTNVNKLQNEMYDRQQAAQERNAAVTQAKALVPDIPDAILAPLTTPEQIMAAAQALKLQADARTPATPPVTPPPGTQSWGTGPPTETSGTPADPNDPKPWHDNMTKLAEEVETNAGRAGRAQEKFGEEFFKARILPGMIRPDLYKQVTGNEAIIERPRG